MSWIWWSASTTELRGIARPCARCRAGGRPTGRGPTARSVARRSSREVVGRLEHVEARRSACARVRAPAAKNTCASTSTPRLMCATSLVVQPVLDHRLAHHRADRAARGVLDHEAEARDVIEALGEPDRARDRSAASRSSSSRAGRSRPRTGCPRRGAPRSRSPAGCPSTAVICSSNSASAPHAGWIERFLPSWPDARAEALLRRGGAAS